AASHLVRTIENTVGSRPGSAILLPDFVTRRELVERLADRLAPGRSTLTLAEREGLLGAACRAARNDGADPPFRLRPGLLLEILRFYDTLLRHRQDVASFERLALGTL